MRGAPAADSNNNNNKQTGIDGERLLSGLIAHHLEDLTVVVNEREREREEEQSAGRKLHSGEAAVVGGFGGGGVGVL